MQKGRIFLLVLLFALNLQAQQEYVFNRIGREDGFGLASNIVTSLYQDEKGFMWVGSYNGLQRFDGSKFIDYARPKQGFDNLPVAELSQILPAGGGKLLLAFAPLREFGIFDPATFEYRKITVTTKGEIWKRAAHNIWRDSKGEIYLQIELYGILHYDARKNTFTDDHHFHLPSNYKLAKNGVYEDVAAKQIWLACEQGLCIYDEQSGETWWHQNNPRHLAVLDNPVLLDRPHTVFIDSYRRFWVLTWHVNEVQEVYCQDSAGHYLPENLIGLSQAHRYEEYVSIFETKKRNIWLYGDGCLYHYDNKSGKFIYHQSLTYGPDKADINYGHVFQILEDRDGGIWVATDKGLYIAPSQSGAYSITNFLGKKSMNITDVQQTSNGNYWVTNWGGGIKLLDSNFSILPHEIYNTSPPASWKQSQKDAAKLTWAACELPSAKQLMIGCQAGVLLIYDSVRRNTAYLQVPECNGSTIRCIVKDKKGVVWMGTHGGRIIKYSNGVFTVLQDLGNIIVRIFIDHDGLIWFFAEQVGLYAMDAESGKILQHYSAGNHPNALASNYGKDIQQLNDSIIVTGAGTLNFINKHSGIVEQRGYEAGLSSNSIYRICEDNGYLWIITSEGLCRYNPANKRFTAYGRRDGITVGSLTTEAALKTLDGRIIFGGANAMLSFKPSIFRANLVPPNVSITDFKIFNENIPVDSLLQHREIRLAPDQNSFSIYFSSLSYLQHDQLTYYFKMDGIDDRWRTDNGRYQNYALLPPGTYTFSAYCENMEGIRSANTTSVIIVIEPPFWKTKWFIALLICLLILIGYAVHSSRLNRLLAVEKLRHKVARDLHDDMGSTLSTINILSSMVKTKIGTDTVKAAEYVGKIGDNSQRMMDAMDDIVWSIKPSNDSMQKIAARMREFATSVLEAKEIDFDFKIEEDVYGVRLDMAARRDFFLIFKEAVNNVAKYSAATQLHAAISLQPHQLNLLIADNGRGFHLNKADNGNGISNMQKRAEAMNSKLTIVTAPGEGCRISLIVPLQK